MKKILKDDEYATVVVEAAITGWIVKESKKPAMRNSGDPTTPKTAG